MARHYHPPTDISQVIMEHKQGPNDTVQSGLLPKAKQDRVIKALRLSWSQR